MYSEYWNLTKPPFDNVPDASMYVDCHESMENVIAETIYAIKEGNECLTVIVGEVGLGKTLSLRVIIDSLEPEKYKVALITNPALSFVQLLKEIIGQITGKQCDIKNKVDLQEKFNRLLFETADQGKKIVIVIDEANVLSPSNLDDLRLLTNMQDDERNLFTLLLVGQMEFAQTLEHPKRANLFQRIGTYGHLEKLPSEEAVKTYVESRLKIAGCDRKIFDDDAIPVIWEFSEHGVPRLINKICKLCIKAGETNEFESISGEVAIQIADRFQKLSKTPTQKRRQLGPPDTEPSEEAAKEPEAEKMPRVPRPPAPAKEMPKKPPMEPVAPPWEEAKPVQPRMTTPQRPPVEPAAPQWEEARQFQPRAAMPQQTPEPVHHPQEEIKPEPKVTTPQRPPVEPAAPQWEEARQFQPRAAMPQQTPEPVHHPQEEIKPVPPKMVPLGKTTANPVPVQGVPQGRTAPPQPSSSPAETQPLETMEQQTQAEQEVFEEVFVGKQKIQLAIPSHVIKQAQTATNQNKNKLAGYWAAQILKGNPQMMHSSLFDPVTVWFEVKNIVLKKFNSA
jgi:general secretion pathway protein A